MGTLFQKILLIVLGLIKAALVTTYYDALAGH